MANLNEIVAELHALTKIPDLIKTLPTYDGTRSNLLPFIEQATSRLEIYRPLTQVPNGLAVYNAYCSVVRAKCIGKAVEVLTSANIRADNWSAVKVKLIETFSDKRDLATLLQNIPYMKQGTSKSLEEFYNEIQKLESDINQNVRASQDYIVGFGK